MTSTVEFVPESPVVSEETPDRPRSAGQWRPIESAPMDGTRFIGATFRRHYFRLNLMWWQPEFDAFISGARIMTMAPGYTVNGVASKMHSPDLEEPTHWLPFPEPPATGASASTGVRAGQLRENPQ